MNQEIIKVKTESTSDSNTLKYNFSKNITDIDEKTFSSKSETEDFKLASEIFTIEGVQKLVIGNDYIYITKSDELSWEELNSSLAPKIEAFFEDLNAEELKKIKDMSESELETFNDIKKVLDSEVSPFLKADGGDIELVSFKNGKVYVTMLGACHGCPGAMMTIKSVVEKILKKHIEGIDEVIRI